MSGHNKWSSIKHKKAAVDAKRGKIFSRLGKEITLAAREGGGDSEMNPRLRTAIDSAKEENMPNDNIERALKKGTGELDGQKLEEMSYEGYAPGGVAIYVSCLSDNRNRTAANVRSYFTQHNGNLAENGAVSWMFQRKARFLVQSEDEEKVLEVLLDAGAETADTDAADGTVEILAAPEEFATMVEALKSAELKISESGVEYIPDNTIEINDVNTGRKIVRMIEEIEEDDDVQQVYTNLDLADEVARELT
ncbi:MAG: YebC/PmpR family DNA-binding transcriptional regulator [Lentisphaeria bacterium]